MKKILYCPVYLILILGMQQTFATEGFIAQENGKILKSTGECNLRYSPGCDFSILLSLIGFDSGVLKDEKTPVWHYEDGYEKFLNVWKKPHNPRSWIVDSCVWYSGNIVEKVGFVKIQEYINQFKFGNRDATGINRHDWPGAILISANEYAEFLQKIVIRKLPVNAHAYMMTEKILYIQDLIGGWKLYGKTGVGEGHDQERIGWFVGWVAKDDRYITFASYIQQQTSDSLPSFVARNNAMDELFWLINELES